LNPVYVIKKMLYWLLPRGISDLYDTFVNSKKLIDTVNDEICKNNILYKNIHKGKRCFILCNGPSVQKQNLKPLKNEIVFSVSSGYHHKDYYILKPKYHCVPQITYTDLFTRDTTIAWFKEMHSKIGNAELFLNSSEEEIVKSHGLFNGRNVNYVMFNGEFDVGLTEIIDIDKPIPSVMSVPIMCIMIAMYMGFKKIYLIGVDHDEFITRQYKYFYKPTVLKGKIDYEDKNGNLKYGLYEMFLGYSKIWTQYRILKNIAIAQGISIYNATYGGQLDEFERVELSQVIKK